MESIGVYLPPRSVSTEEVLKGCANKVYLPLERLTGIESRRVAGEGEWGYELAVNAVQDCLEHSRYGPGDIDVLINCNISHLDGEDRCTFEPSRSARMRRTFGMHDALAFDLTNACAGMFTGIYLVDALIRAGAVRRGLVVSGEYITHLTETAQKEIKGLADPRLACLTLGDAGAAVLVDAAADERSGFHALELYSISKYSPLCVAKVTTQPHGGAIMVTDMIQLSNIAVSAFLQQSALIVVRLGWPAGDIQHVLPHQTSKTTLDTGSRTVKRLVGDRGLNVEQQKLINNVADRGNTATTSHFVALMDSIASGRVQSGDGIVFGILASGITVGTAVYRFDDLPRRRRESTPRGLEIGPPPAPSARIGSYARAATSPRVRFEAVGLLDPDRSGPVDTLAVLADASLECLSRSRHAAGDVDLLLHTGLYRTGFLCEPAIATLLAGLLKINDSPATPMDRHSLAFDLLNGSLGFLNACYIASVLISIKAARRVLIAASEVENNAKALPDCLRGLTQTASAAMLDAEGPNDEGFGAFHFRFFPEHQEALSVFGSTRQLLVDGRYIARLHVETMPDLESRITRCIIESVSEFLDAQGLSKADLALVIAPQISSEFLTGLATAMDMDRRLFVDATRPEGDLFTSSVPYAFAAATQPGRRPQPGQIGLIVSVAAGIEVGCAIYHF